MKEKKQIPANLNPEVMINETDRNCYVFRWKKVSINPEDPKHPVVKTEIKPIRKNDYQRYFTGTEEQKSRRMQIIGVDEAELIHDPTKPMAETEEKALDPVPFTKVSEKDPVLWSQAMEEARKLAAHLRGVNRAKFINQKAEELYKGMI